MVGFSTVGPAPRSDNNQLLARSNKIFGPGVVIFFPLSSDLSLVVGRHEALDSDPDCQANPNHGLRSLGPSISPISCYPLLQQVAIHGWLGSTLSVNRSGPFYNQAKTALRREPSPYDILNWNTVWAAGQVLEVDADVQP